MKFITVSGIDKAGKTSIINAYLKKTKYVDYLVDRDPSNFMSLNDVQDRIQTIEQMDNYYEFIARFKENVDLAVLVTASPDVLDKRFALNHEPPLVGELSKEQHQKMIESYFKIADYPNSLVIDTTDKTIDQCVNLIIKHLQD